MNIDIDKKRAYILIEIDRDILFETDFEEQLHEMILNSEGEYEYQISIGLR